MTRHGMAKAHFIVRHTRVIADGTVFGSAPLPFQREGKLDLHPARRVQGQAHRHKLL